jgi:HK97 family phage major capsid protein
MPVNGKSTITLTTKMIQPKLNVGWVPISWEALNQGAIRSDDQLVPAFTDAFAQIIEAGVMSGGSGFAGITQETAAQNFVATADTAASHWEQLVLMATSIATYVPYGASIIMSAGEKSFLINEGIGVSGGHFLAQELARSNSILGVPVIVEPNMTWSAANGIKAYAYPMSDYGIVYVNSMELVWKEGPAGDTSKVLEARYAFGGAPVVGGANLFTMTQTV